MNENKDALSRRAGGGQWKKFDFTQSLGALSCTQLKKTPLKSKLNNIPSKMERFT